MALPEIARDALGRASDLTLQAIFFCVLALLVKGAKAWADARAAAEETRINAIIFIIDQILVAPIVVLLAGAFAQYAHAMGWDAPGAAFWAKLGGPATGLIAIFVADFLGYWRHRLQHTALLWPGHAVHHSDTQLTWFTLMRMHPVDRLGTMLDLLGLILLGFPVWAVALAVSVRHYYGAFIHADVPWTLGKLNWVMNSPAMHRWHHARDEKVSGKNFATVFSVFDRAFGTYYCPGPCDVPLGIEAPMEPGALGQYIYPLQAWFGPRPQPVETHS
jgi:sterol desaturase/sphingolipid hydroxylase (fatty acid hydroxylase superfamily)